jgi:hypothetical protein
MFLLYADLERPYDHEVTLLFPIVVIHITSFQDELVASDRRLIVIIIIIP